MAQEMCAACAQSGSSPRPPSAVSRRFSVVAGSCRTARELANTWGFALAISAGDQLGQMAPSWLAT